jgi:hypothetical protein
MNRRAPPNLGGGFDLGRTDGHLSTVHQRREQESLEIHRCIARRLDHDAAPVLEKARANLRRWLSDRGEDSLTAVYREWESLLGSLTASQISELLVAEDERSTRLRQSSPFAGVLPPREVWEIKRRSRHAAA